MSWIRWIAFRRYNFVQAIAMWEAGAYMQDGRYLAAVTTLIVACLISAAFSTIADYGSGNAGVASDKKGA